MREGEMVYKKPAYLIYINEDAIGYLENEQDAQNYIYELAKSAKKDYNKMYPGWTKWARLVMLFRLGDLGFLKNKLGCYGEIKLITLYDFWIFRYARTEHTFKYQGILPLSLNP